MSPPSRKAEPHFVVATPGRSVCDDNARALVRQGRLRFYALGTRRGTDGIPAELTRLYPKFGLATYLAARTLSSSKSESFRFHLLPWFDRWVCKQLQPGDHVISSYGYVNASFRRARQQGGKTFLDGGNSHIQNYWDVIREEHRRWKSELPPFSPYWLKRSLEGLEEVDFVLSPSSYVTRTFLERGFKPEQIIRNVYPLDLSCFKPSGEPRPKDRPLTVVNTGSVSLRKGAPYLLEAFKTVLRRHPTARLRLTSNIQDDVKPILAKYGDLPIDWTPSLPHPRLAEWLRGGDIFILPSLEDGFARTVTEALACGLPVITTPNTGASDLIQSGVNGEVVPIRDSPAIAEAVSRWADKILTSEWQPRCLVDPQRLGFEHFEREFLAQLAERKLI